MALLGEYFALSARAAVNLKDEQYHLMRSTTWQTNAPALVDIASNAAATAVLGVWGVLMNNPDSGQAATVAWQGEVKVVAGAAITAGVLITNDSSGRAVAAVSGDLVIGRAWEAAGAGGETIRALIGQPYPLLRT